MPWPTIEIFLLSCNATKKPLTIINLHIQPLLYFPTLIFQQEVFCLTHPLDGRVLLGFQHIFFPVCLPSVDLILKQAHPTLEILESQNVVFRYCLFIWPGSFVLHIQ